MQPDDISGYADPRAGTARFYDLVPAYVERGDVDFYVEEAVRSGGPVLELGCGTGRILLPTARAGVAVTGLDAAETMLDQLRVKLEREPDDVRDRVTLVSGDVRAFELPERFALATLPFRVLQHIIEVDDQMAALRAVHRHLRPDGRLAFDVFCVNPGMTRGEPWAEERPDFGPVPLPGGGTLRRAHRITGFHPGRQVNDTELIYHIRHADGREERLVHTFPFRYYYPFELRHLLARCGFEIDAVYGDFARTPFSDAAREQVVIARKAAP